MDATQVNFRNSAWSSPRSARTFQALMALQHKEFGERLARLRALKGKPPQEAVAHALGVSNRSYQAWEAGESRPSYRNMERLADYFGVAMPFLLTGEREPRVEVEQLDRLEGYVERLLAAHHEQPLTIATTSAPQDLSEQVAACRRGRRGACFEVDCMEDTHGPA